MTTGQWCSTAVLLPSQEDSLAWLVLAVWVLASTTTTVTESSLHQRVSRRDSETAEKLFISFLNKPTHHTKGNRSFAWPATNRAHPHSQSNKAFANFKGQLQRPVI